MLTMLAIIAAVLLVLAASRVRAALPGDVPTRLLVGDGAMTGDGVTGTVVEVTHPALLVQVDESRSVWVQRSAALAWNGPRPEPRTDAAGAVAETIHGDLPSGAETPHGGFADLGHAISLHGKRFALLWLAAVLVGLPLGATLQPALSSGGFTPPGEAMNVGDEVRTTFGQPATSVVVITTDDAKTATARFAPQLAALRKVEKVDDAKGLGTFTPSKDGTHSIASIGFRATDDSVWASVDAVESIAAKAKLDHAEVGGTPVVFRDINVQTQKDLEHAETIGMPIALLILLLVFGTVPAAIVPLAIGIVSVLTTLALLRLVAMTTDLSIYVMNIVTMLGLGLGIDYSLLGVSRFREELAGGRTVADAVTRTVATAGKATVISGVAVLTGLSGLALFPLGVLQSMAIAGVIVVAVSVAASVTLLPALLALLGHRIERWRVRRAPVLGKADLADSNRWMRLASRVMRHPGLALAAGVVLLIVLAHPATGARLDVPHSSVLPATAPARVAEKTLHDHFGAAIASSTWVVARTTDPAQVATFAKQLAAVKNVATSQAAGSAKGQTLFRLTVTKDPEGGPAARKVVDDVHALRIAGAAHPTPRVGGQAAEEIAFLHAINANAGKAALFVAISIFAILLIAFRSLLLPLKAIVLDALSITAALGTVILVFQDGHGAGLLGASGVGYTEATMPVLLFAILFGLSMDYEVFMLANIAELYQQGASNREATARGMAWTAPLVTGAALILIAIGLSFASTELVLVKQIGFGMAVALALDATVVRCLLVPASMRLLDDRNWWLPARISRYVPRMDWSH